MTYKKITLKKGREIPVKNHHHWIFSGAIDGLPAYENGEILAVYTFDGNILGHAYFNKTTDIAGRMINFDNLDPVTSLKQNILEAIMFRENFFDKSTNCFRLINGEGDAVPGLVVDKYNDVLVIQISTWGIEKLKQEVLGVLKDFYKDKISCIYERSDISSRKREGLQNSRGFLLGQEKSRVEVLENGIKFDVDFINGQKTGLFMDMREMRHLVTHISENKRVLNCFCYTGAFSLYALKGNANSVTSVDISKDAVEAVKAHLVLNKFDPEKNPAIAEDVFDFLRKESLDYDLVILDPPAFAKKKSDLDSAKKAYYEINKTSFSKMPAHSMLLTCSCSYHLDELTFERIVAKAAKDAGRTIKMMSKHRLAPDHPINMYHTEMDYLKSMLIYVV